MNTKYPNIRIFQKAALATLLTLAIVFATLLYFEINTKKEHKEFMVLVDKQDFVVPKEIQKEKQIKELDKTINQLLNSENHINTAMLQLINQIRPNKTT